MLQPFRSRSSHSLTCEKPIPKRPESQCSSVSRAMARQISIPQRYEKSASSKLLTFSGSSSSFDSDSKHINHEQALPGKNFFHNKYATSTRESPQQLRSTFSTKKSTPSDSKSSPTSFITSPRHSRSRSSHSPVKRRAESPAGKDPSSRHGWLYTQQFSYPADVPRGREGRHNYNNTVRWGCHKDLSSI